MNNNKEKKKKITMKNAKMLRGILLNAATLHWQQMNFSSGHLIEKLEKKLDELSNHELLVGQLTREQFCSGK